MGSRSQAIWPLALEHLALAGHLCRRCNAAAGTAVRGAERSKVPPRPLSIAVQGTECGPPQSPRRAHPRSLQGPPSQHDPPASHQPAVDVKQAT